MLDLPKHPLERKTKCPICSVEYSTIPLRRAAAPDEPGQVLEQHACTNGHVYVTEIGSDTMLAEW
jgi:hypothetical protein